MEMHSPVELLCAKPAALSALSQPIDCEASGQLAEFELSVRFKNAHPIHPSRTFRQYSLHFHCQVLDRQALVCAPKATRNTIGDASRETHWERKDSRRFQRHEGTQSPEYLVEEIWWAVLAFEEVGLATVRPAWSPVVSQLRAHLFLSLSGLYPFPMEHLEERSGQSRA